MSRRHQAAPSNLTPNEPAELGGSAAYFDLVSADYFRRYEERTPGGYAFRVRKQRLFELLDGNGGKLLDVGCGPGVMVPDLIGLGYEFWGVDASQRMIEECHKSFGQNTRAHFLLGDAVKTGLPDESFDTVICTGVIDHVPDCALAVREMLRVLKKEGTLLISFPNIYSPWALWRNDVFYPVLRLLRPLYYQLLGRSRPPALRSRAKLHSELGATKLIEDCDGEVVESVYYNFNLFLSPADEVFPRATMWLAKKLEPYHRGTLRWLGSGFILKVSKGLAAK